jgi:hypothetical protein
MAVITVYQLSVGEFNSRCYTENMEPTNPTPTVPENTPSKLPKFTVPELPPFFSQIGFTIKNHIAVLSVAIFVIISLIVIIFLYNQNQQLKNILIKNQSASPTPTVANVNIKRPTWRVYISDPDKYKIEVPKEWNEIVHLATAPHQAIFKSDDGLYRLTLDAENNLDPTTKAAYTSLDNFIGLPYTVKSLTVGGLDARQPLPRAGSESLFKVFFFSKDLKLIYSIELLVGDGSGNDHRVTPEAIQIAEGIFTDILSTFEFTSTDPIAPINPEPPVSSPTACTMEAKLCSDGSSVGRSGPNCEFAPCPTPKN